jgi:hypothetical protein
MLDANRRDQYQLRWLKRWIWVYFWVLIFEGALRKWIFPSLSGPLLLVRDPVAVIVYIQAYRCRKLSMKTMWPIAILTVGMCLLALAQIVAGVNTPPIALYGLRSYLLHLPLIFIIADTLDEEDLHRLGRWLLLLSVPMTALVLAQFNAPANSWLNAGAGENAAQILSAGGHVRPAGTFSYGIGMQCLAILVAAFIVDALMRKGIYPRWLLWPALLATVATIPLLGSRTVLFTMAALSVFTFFSGMSQAARLAGLLKIVVVLLLAGFVAVQLPFFNHAVDTMTERWQQAAKSEGGVEDVLNKRVLGVFEAGGEAGASAPWLGTGVGMGSNFAAAVTGNEGTFLAGENEWERVVVEFGPLCGLLFMGARVCFAIYMVMQAMRALKRNAALAWLLVPAVVPLLIMTIMEQPTFLGFMVFGAGLCLAAARTGGSAMHGGTAGAV